jgi:hypothetical protein
VIFKKLTITRLLRNVHHVQVLVDLVVLAEVAFEVMVNFACHAGVLEDEYVQNVMEKVKSKNRLIIFYTMS